MEATYRSYLQGTYVWGEIEIGSLDILSMRQVRNLSSLLIEPKHDRLLK